MDQTKSCNIFVTLFDFNNPLVLAAYSLLVIKIVMIVAVYLIFKYRQRQLVDVSVSGSKNYAVLITGCDSGLGLAFAKHLHKITNMTLICSFYDTKNLASSAYDPQTVQNLQKSNGYKELKQLSLNDKIKRMHLVPLDLCQDSSIKDLVAYLNQAQQDKHFKQLWAVINNAGLLYLSEFDWHSLKNIEQVMTVNLVGPLKLTNLLLPKIIASKGRVINISSSGDVALAPFLTVYSASKAGLSRFSSNLRIELQKFGCKVINIRPLAFANHSSMIQTSMSYYDVMFTQMDESKQRLYKEYYKRTKVTEDMMRRVTIFSAKSIDPIINDFEIAVLSKYPPNSILSGPCKQKFAFALKNLIPANIEAYLVGKFIANHFGYSDEFLDKDELKKIQMDSS